MESKAGKFCFVAQLVTFSDFSSPSGSQGLRGACPLFEDIPLPKTNIFSLKNRLSLKDRMVFPPSISRCELC